MRGFEHFILKHIVLDKSFNIISEKIFDPSKDRAFSNMIYLAIMIVYLC